MLSNPFSHIDDEVHGESMQYYSEIIVSTSRTQWPPQSMDEASGYPKDFIDKGGSQNRWAGKLTQNQIDEMQTWGW